MNAPSFRSLENKRQQTSKKPYLQMSKKAGNQGRKKGSDKRKNTFKKFGKNTKRGIRIKTAELQNKDAKTKVVNNQPKTKK